MARLPKHEIAEITGINMTPLIDVVMQLLLFFMLTSSMIKPNRIELELPESTSGVRAAEVDSITVDYRLESGAPRITLNGETLEDLTALAGRLKAMDRSDAQPEVAIRIDKTVPYQDVVTLMDTVRDAGFPKFALHTLALSPTSAR